MRSGSKKILLGGADEDLIRALREAEAASYRFDKTKETAEAFRLRVASDRQQGLITEAQAKEYIWNAFGNPDAKIFTSDGRSGVISIRPSDVPAQGKPKSATDRFLDWWRCSDAKSGLPLGVGDSVARGACYTRNAGIVIGSALAIGVAFFILDKVS